MKQVIRLTESDLHRMIKESVKDIIQQNQKYDRNVIGKSEDERENRAKWDEREIYDYRSTEEIQNALYDMKEIVYSMYGNPRLSNDFLQNISNKISELQKLFSDKSPLMDAQANQHFNKWTKKKADKGYRYKSQYLPSKGFKENNKNGAISLINPLTGKKEGFTQSKALKVLRDMYKQCQQEGNPYKFESRYDIVFGDGDYEISEKQLKDGNFDAVELLYSYVGSLGNQKQMDKEEELERFYYGDDE